MVKVITYGTYDLLHYGHIRLLERAKALGDYLIVGVTSDDFDKSRGKINVQQSLMERIEAVKKTGLADEIIVEEYEGQKIDDIKRFGIDIFTVGSDWKGKFDYIKEYCKVIYLERTEGISSTDLRAEKNLISLGLVGESNVIDKFADECTYVNGVKISGIYSTDLDRLSSKLKSQCYITKSYDELLSLSDAVYLVSHPRKHFEQSKLALEKKKHVLCESPVSMNSEDCCFLYDLAKKNGCIISEAIKTAYSTAYERLLLLVKSGIIGDIVSVDTTCTSLRYKEYDKKELDSIWNGLCAWGPTAMLPIFQLFGTNYSEKRMVSRVVTDDKKFDLFSKIDFVYTNSVGSIKIGEGVKSEGDLVISGTKGYAYVPSPWWKTDYFEIRFENQEENKRYFYQLEGEGIRYEIISFINAIKTGKNIQLVGEEISMAITKVIEDFEDSIDVLYI